MAGSDPLAEIVIITQVFVFGIGTRTQVQRKGIGTEIFHVSPGQGRQIKALVRTIQMIAPFTAVRVLYHHIETARQGHHYFLMGLEGVSAPDFPTGYIVGPVYPFYYKREVTLVFHKGQVSPGIEYFG